MIIRFDFLVFHYSTEKKNITSFCICLWLYEQIKVVTEHKLVYLEST